MVSDLELVILSLVAESPRESDALNALIHQRGLRDWLTVGSTSVAQALKGLEAQSLLTPMQANRGTTVYQVTEAGRGVLQTAIAYRLRQPRALGSDVELALANLRALKPAQVYEALLERRDTLGIQGAAAEAALDQTASQEDGWMLYSHAAAMARAEIAWLDTFLQAWTRRYPNVTQHSVPETFPDELPTLDDTASSAPTLIHHATANQNPVKRMQKMSRH